MVITAIKLVASECVTPAVINGRISNVDGAGYQTGDTVEEDEVVSVACNQKFFLDLNSTRENVIKCLRGKWNKKFPECYGNFIYSLLVLLKLVFIFRLFQWMKSVVNI